MLFVTQIHQNHNLMAVSLTMLKGINIQTNELSANIGMICSGYVVKSEMVQKKKKKGKTSSRKRCKQMGRSEAFVTRVHGRMDL